MKLYSYLGQCDFLRKKSSCNEEYWHEMMLNKKEISQQKFVSLADISPLLDKDETVRQYLSYHTDIKFYISNWGDSECLFYQTAGFEFIFLKNF